MFILLFLVHVSWSLVSPVGSSPDEDTHLNSIYCLSKFDKSPCDSLNERIVNIGKCFYLDSNQPASCDQYVTNEVAVVTRATTESIYYRTLSVFATDNLEKSVLMMRFFNSFLSIFIFFIIYKIATLKIFAAALITWLTVNLPLGFYLVSSINTSSWLILFSILFTVLIYQITLDVEHTELKIILAVFIYFIASTARPDTKLIAGVILISFIPLITQNFKLNIIKTAIILISTLITFYFLYNIWTRSSIANSGRELSIPIWEHLYRITSIPLGAFGGWGLGSLEIDLPALVSVTTNFLILGIFIFSLKYTNFGSNFSKLIIFTFIYCVPLFVIIQSNLQVGEWYQPRYILPLFSPLIFLSIISILNYRKIFNSLFYFVSIIGTLSFLTALHTTARRYTHGSENFVLNLNSNFKWWWSDQLVISPMFVISIGTFSYLLIFFILIKRLQSIKNFSN